ncbi:MAG: PilZ domain-containing protein [Hyphomicrobiales bacterium]
MFGRFMLPDTSEHPCQVKELSLDGAVFITGQIAQGGTQLVAYIDDVGRVEALSAEPVPGGFRVIFSHAGARRDRFAARLDWVYSRKDQQATEERRRFRYEVPDKSSYITLPDGRIYPCEVIDISLSGAAVKVDVMPSLGTDVMLGKMRARIVRYHENGVALEFVKPLDWAQLNEQLR